MKILFLNWRDISNSQAGGAEVYVHEVAKKLVKKGYEVSLFCRRDKLPERDQIDGVNIYRAGGQFSVFIWAKIYWFLKFRREGYDTIIESQIGIPFLTPLYISSKVKIIYIIHHIHREAFNHYLYFPFNKIASIVEKWGIPFVYRNRNGVVVSDSTLEDVKKGFLKKYHSNFKIISPGVNLEKCQPVLFNNKSLQPLLVYLGRVSRPKSLDIAIKAFYGVTKEIPEINFIIAGDGDALIDIKILIKELKLEERVIIKGWVSEEEKMKLLQDAWIFLQPSSKEGFGITVSEANACGTPVIASNVPGLKDSVTHGINGLLVPYGNVLEWKRAILNLIKDENLRKKLSEQSIQISKERSWDKTATKFEEMIELRI